MLYEQDDEYEDQAEQDKINDIYEEAGYDGGGLAIDNAEYGDEDDEYNPTARSSDENEYAERGSDDQKNYVDNMFDDGDDELQEGKKQSNDEDDDEDEDEEDDDDEAMQGVGAAAKSPQQKATQQLCNFIKKLNPFAFVRKFWKVIRNLPFGGIKGICKQINELLKKTLIKLTQGWIVPLGIVFIEFYVDTMSFVLNTLAGLFDRLVELLFKILGPIINPLLEKIKALYIKYLKEKVQKATAGVRRFVGRVKSAAQTAYGAVSVASIFNKDARAIKKQVDEGKKKIQPYVQKASEFKEKFDNA